MLWGWIVPFMPARWGTAHFYRAWTSACMRAFWTDIKHGPGASLWPLYVSRKPLTAKGYPGQWQPGWPGLHSEERERYRARREGTGEMEKWEERAAQCIFVPKQSQHLTELLVWCTPTPLRVLWLPAKAVKQIPTYTLHSANTLLYFSSCR